LIKTLVVAGLDELTPDWATAALGSGAATATSVEVAGVVTGSNIKARLAIEWAGADAARQPHAVVVKANFAHRDGGDDIDRSWNDLHRLLNASEARFYREFAGLLSMRVPTCYLASTDEQTGESLLVLADLTASGHTFAAFDQPFSADLAAAALEQLALLHSATWQNPVVLGAGLRDAMAESGMMDAFLSPVNWDQQMARARGAYVPESLRDRDLVARAVRAAWARKRSEPVCLIHGDPHVGNYYLSADGQPGLLDWPLSTVGNWAWDVGYSLASALTIDDRRALERDLLAHYLACLQRNGVTPPDFDAAWLSYRQFSIWGFLAFLTPASVQTEEYNSVVGQRHATAAVDLDALGALGIT
jgi:aminoglycoside phosphotransferase (APT) family kinase protein